MKTLSKFFVFLLTFMVIIIVFIPWIRSINLEPLTAEIDGIVRMKENIKTISHPKGGGFSVHYSTTLIVYYDSLASDNYRVVRLNDYYSPSLNEMCKDGLSGTLYSRYNIGDKFRSTFETSELKRKRYIEAKVQRGINDVFIGVLVISWLISIFIYMYLKES